MGFQDLEDCLRALNQNADSIAQVEFPENREESLKVRHAQSQRYAQLTIGLAACTISKGSSNQELRL